MREQTVSSLVYKFLIISMFCLGFVFSSEPSVEGKTDLEIKKVLQQWSLDFNAKNIIGTCGIFAPDLVASYPGVSDKNCEEMCRALTKSLTDPDKTFSYEAPLIEQMIFQGDLCIVRLIWTLKISYINGSKTEIIREKGVDVFKKQANGVWKIVISYAYPLADS